MVATIANYPDKPTVAYAELWSADSFVIVSNSWWPHAPLTSENKGDERNIGATYKCDIPARCWIFWEGTATENGRRVLQVQRAADGHPLDEPPGPGFLPVEPGVNLIEFGDEEPEPPEEPGGDEPPETPQPEPEPPTELPYPQFITIFVGGSGQQTTPIVHWRQLGEKGTDSEFWELVMVIRGDHYDELWKGLEQQLMEAMHGG